MHSDRINSTKIQTGTQQNISSFILSVYVISYFFQNNLFLHYVLILSQIDPKWFCLWGKQREKWELLSQEDKKKILAADFSRCHGNRTFKEFWWEQQAKRGWLQGRQFITSTARTTQSDCAHIHNHCVVFFIWTTVKKNTAFLPHRDPSVRGWESAVIVLWHGDEGLRLEPGRQRLF